MSIGWHGTTHEYRELVAAVQRNCTCLADRSVAAAVEPGMLCPAHRILADEQQTVDRLLFVRRIAARLRAEEFHLRERPD